MKINPIQALETFEFTKRLKQESLELIQQTVSIYESNAHKVLIQKGDVINGALLVCHGTLRAFGLNEAGKEATFFLAKPGDSCMLALNCVFNSIIRYPAYLQAVTKSKYAVIPRETYLKLFESEKELRVFTFQTMSKRIYDLINVAEGFSTASTSWRLANFIIHHADENGTLYISHEEIASHIACTRETVSRILKKFETQKAIKLSRNKLILLNPKILRSMQS